MPARWSFQIVESVDDGYWSVFREHEQMVRDQLVGGRRHVFEAEMKERRRTPGREGHEAARTEFPGGRVGQSYTCRLARLGYFGKRWNSLESSYLARHP